MTPVFSKAALPPTVPTGQEAIVVRDAGVQVDGVWILQDVSVSVCAGEVLALVGPNGAGKSTLLTVVAGDLAPTRGRVSIAGGEAGSWSALELARLRAVLTQESSVSFPFRSGQVVAMGRNPWAGTERSDEDDEAVRSAMRLTDVLDLSQRRYTSLSGGEKARVSLARILAQRTGIVLLDEPTAALDLRHQEDVMTIASGLAAAGRAVVVVLHDLSLAAAYADRVAVLAHGQLRAIGRPEEVFRRELVREVYGLDVEILQQESTGRPLIVPVRASRPGVRA